MDLSSVTLQEIKLLTELGRTKSIRELARREQMPPSQVSKAIKRLERKTGLKLIERSVQGVVLTLDALRSLPVFQDILERADTLKLVKGQTTKRSVLGIGSTSFLINHLLTKAFADLKDTQVRFRFLEISPDQFTTAGLRHAFEVAFHFGKLEWPGTWHQEKIGEVRWRLCCRAGHPLLKLKTISRKDILAYPFILPAYWTQEGFSLGNDECPIPMDRRLRGHETSTAEAALALVRRTDQVAYLPEILIRTYADLGEVVAVDARGTTSEPRALYVAARSDLITDKLFQVLIEAVRSET